MKLNVNEWKEFQVGRLFNCTLSTGDLKIDDCEPGNIPLISSGETNNGLVGYIDEKGDGKAKIFLRGKITVDMFCNAFYQDRDFYSVSHGRVNILDPIFDWNDANLLFIATIINKEQFKYSYGRAVYNAEISRMIIKLPVCVDQTGAPIIDKTCQYSDEGYIPDWQYMEDFIKTLHYKPITTKNTQSDAGKIDTTDWEEFTVGNIFDCATTSPLKIEEAIDGTVPYITRSAENNGCSGYLANTDKLVDGNCITIGAEGGVAFYQPENFIPGVKVYTLRNKELTKYSYLFMVAILNLSSYIYSYGRARILDKIIEEQVKLPIQRNEDGTPKIDCNHKYSPNGYMPDWELMSNYIKSLPYGDKI